MITPAQRAEIRRLYYSEHWKLGTIAAELGLHRETVRAAVRARAGSRPPRPVSTQRPRPLPAVHPRHPRPVPRLRATRIHEMVRLRGYPGSVNQLRRIVKRLRPETGRTAYRRVVTLGRRVGAGRLGLLRQGPHRTRHPRRLRIRHGPRLLARPRRPLHPRPDPRELPPADTSKPSTPWAASPAPSCTTTSEAPSSTAAAPPSSSTPACSSSPATTTSPPGPARRDAEMRRGKSSGRSNTYATPSSPPGPSATSTTSTPSSGAGGTTSPINDATPSNPTVPSPRSGPTRSPACCRSPPIPSRPN